MARHVPTITVHQIRNVQRTIHAKPEFETAVYRILYGILRWVLPVRFCLGRVGAVRDVGGPDFEFLVRDVEEMMDK